MQVLPAKIREENCRGDIREDEGNKIRNILQIYVNQTSLRRKSYFPYSEFARGLFPVEKTNKIKIKKTHHRTVGDG